MKSIFKFTIIGFVQFIGVIIGVLFFLLYFHGLFPNKESVTFNIDNPKIEITYQKTASLLYLRGYYRKVMFKTSNMEPSIDFKPNTKNHERTHIEVFHARHVTDKRTFILLSDKIHDQIKDTFIDVNTPNTLIFSNPNLDKDVTRRYKEFNIGNKIGVIDDNNEDNELRFIPFEK